MYSLNGTSEPLVFLRKTNISSGNAIENTCISSTLKIKSGALRLHASVCIRIGPTGIRMDPYRSDGHPYASVSVRWASVWICMGPTGIRMDPYRSDRHPYASVSVRRASICIHMGPTGICMHPYGSHGHLYGRARARSRDNHHDDTELFPATRPPPSRPGMK